MPTPYGKQTTADELIQDYGSIVKGKVVLTTGVSPGGLGGFFVEALAKGSPGLLILAGRNVEKTTQTAKKIAEIAPGVKTRVLELDLASFASVRKAADEVKTYSENIDVLVNNAGVMAVDYTKTVDGNELHLQANHLSHFLFTNLIIDKILAAGPGSRVVNVSSDAYRLGHVRYYDYAFHDGESYDRWVAYGQSKTANILFSRELAKRLGSKGLLSFSLHPGVIWTNLPSHLGTEEFTALRKLDQQLGMTYGWGEFEALEGNQGVATHTYASFAPELKDHNGAYLDTSKAMKEEDMHPWATSDIEAVKTWELSEKLVGQKFDY